MFQKVSEWLEDYGIIIVCSAVLVVIFIGAVFIGLSFQAALLRPFLK